MTNKHFLKDWNIDIEELMLEAICDTETKKGRVLTEADIDLFKRMISESFDDNKDK